MTTTPFAALGDPTRRRILELLADGEQPVNTLVAALTAQRPISQPAVSQHLQVLRDARLVTVRNDGTRRLHTLDHDGLADAISWLTWLTEHAGPYTQPLDALATEIARGHRANQTKDTPPGTAAAG